MKKVWISRGLYGFPVGIAIGFLLTLLSSFLAGTGEYYPVTPQLTALVGSECGAVLLQTVFCGVIGAGFAIASVIWELDSWSLARQSAAYFGIACLLVLPVAYLSHWMPHTLIGVLSYIGIFAVIFLLAWAMQYRTWKNRLRRINAQMDRQPK